MKSLWVKMNLCKKESLGEESLVEEFLGEKYKRVSG